MYVIDRWIKVGIYKLPIDALFMNASILYYIISIGTSWHT